MANFRNITGQAHTGVTLESVAGVAENLTSANFIGNWVRSPINIQSTSYRMDIGGNVGAGSLTTVDKMGEVTITSPLSEGDVAYSLACGGSVVSGNDYLFGGSYASLRNTDKGILSLSSCTFNHYDGKEKYVLYGAKPASLKISHKTKEAVMIESVWNGLVENSESNIEYAQKPKPNFRVNVAGNLSIGGTAFDYTEIEIDIAPETVMPAVGNTSAGYRAAEIVSVDPKISVTLYPGDPSVKNLWNMFTGRDSVDFSYSFGSGTGNTYTITAKVQISTEEDSPIGNLAGRKLVLIPVFDNVNNYRLKITVA